MALIPDFDVTNLVSCANFQFYDTTGEGATGWGGSGNPALSDVLTASISILPYLSTSSPFVVNVKSGSLPFPNTTNIPFTVLGTSMGLAVNQPIPSQIVSITYNLTFTVMSGFDPVSVTKYVFLDCLSFCCSDQLFAAWAVECGCSDTNKKVKQDLAIKVQGTITAIHKVLDPDCNKITEAQNLVNWLNGVCAGQPCNCH